MTTYLWLAVVVGGPFLIAIALAYGMLTRRTLSSLERQKRNQAIRDMDEK